MNFKPKYYKTHPVSTVLRLESVMDERGNLRYAVTICTSGVKETHFLFEKLCSAIDFIHSNFGR